MCKWISCVTWIKSVLVVFADDHWIQSCFCNGICYVGRILKGINGIQRCIFLGLKVVGQEGWGSEVSPIRLSVQTVHVIIEVYEPRRATQNKPISDAWWLMGRFDVFRPRGRGFESRSSHHVGTLGKSFTRSCLYRFGVKFRHSIRAVSGTPLSSKGLWRGAIEIAWMNERMNEWMNEKLISQLSKRNWD